MALRTADDVSTLNKCVYIVPSALSPRHYLAQRTSCSWIQACVHQITAWFSLLKLIKERQPSPIIKGSEYLRVQSTFLFLFFAVRGEKKEEENEWKALNYLKISEGFLFFSFFPLIALIISPDTFLLPNYSLMHKPLFLFKRVQRQGMKGGAGEGEERNLTSPENISLGIMGEGGIKGGGGGGPLNAACDIDVSLSVALPVSPFWLVDSFSVTAAFQFLGLKEDYGVCSNVGTVTRSRFRSNG